MENEGIFKDLRRRNHTKVTAVWICKCMINAKSISGECVRVWQVETFRVGYVDDVIEIQLKGGYFLTFMIIS